MKTLIISRRIVSGALTAVDVPDWFDPDNPEHVALLEDPPNGPGINELSYNYEEVESDEITSISVHRGSHQSLDPYDFSELENPDAD